MRRLALGGIGLIAALVLAGCGGGSGGLSAPGSEPLTSKARPDEAAGEKAAGSAGQARAQDGGGSKPAALPRVVPEDRAIIYTATLRVRAQEVDSAASRAVQIVTTAGGYVHDEHTTTEPRREASATLTFKIPTEEYRGVLDDLGSRLGTRLHLEQQAQDVTQEVADVDARLESARASLDRLRQLLAEAETIGEVLSVEQEISEREAELESLAARQRALANKTQYATVTLELVAPAAAKNDERDEGFLAGLAAGWGTFLVSLTWLTTALGALLPFLAAFGVIGYAAWRVRAVIRRRRTAPTPPAAPSPPPASS